MPINTLRSTNGFNSNIYYANDIVLYSSHKNLALSINTINNDLITLSES